MADKPDLTKTIAFVMYPGLTPLDLIGPRVRQLTLGSQYGNVWVLAQHNFVAVDCQAGMVPAPSVIAGQMRARCRL